MMTPGDYATLTEEMEHLGTQDYMGAKSWRGINDDDDENHYPFPLVRSFLLTFHPTPLFSPHSRLFHHPPSLISRITISSSSLQLIDSTLTTRS